MADDKKTLVDLLPPGKVKSTGEMIRLRQKHKKLVLDSIGGTPPPPFDQWVKTQ